MLDTIQQAIDIQNDHLAIWKIKLNSKIYMDLERYARATNDTEKDPYKIRRGSCLGGFVDNWKPNKHYEYTSLDVNAKINLKSRLAVGIWSRNSVLSIVLNDIDSFGLDVYLSEQPMFK